MSDVDSKTTEINENGEEPKAEDETQAAEAPQERSPLEEAEAERDRLKDQLLRVAADFDNFRKRTKKDLEHAERRAKEDVLREVLPIIDNLERAVQAAQNATEVSSVAAGVEMVLKLFEDTAARLGLEKITSVGQRFDPSVHDAFQQQESSEHPPGTIIAEYQPGYRLGDRLLRPAMVVVAKKPSEPAQGSEAEETQGANGEGEA